MGSIVQRFFYKGMGNVGLFLMLPPAALIFLGYFVQIPVKTTQEFRKNK